MQPQFKRPKALWRNQIMPINEVYFAIKNGELKLVQTLFAKNKNILEHTFGSIEETPLHISIAYAEKSVDLQIVKYILKELAMLPEEQHKRILNAKNRSSKKTALHIAAEFGNMQVITLLLKDGIDHTITNINDRTARDLLHTFYPEKLAEYDQLIKQYCKPQQEQPLQSRETKEVRTRTASDSNINYTEEKKETHENKRSLSENDIANVSDIGFGSLTNWWYSLFGKPSANNRTTNEGEEEPLLKDEKAKHDSSPSSHLKTQ